MPKRYESLVAYMAGEGKTQVDLAEEWGMSQASVSRIVRGLQLPDAQTALLIAERTGVPIEALVRARAEGVA